MLSFSCTGCQLAELRTALAKPEAMHELLITLVDRLSTGEPPEFAVELVVNLAQYGMHIGSQLLVLCFLKAPFIPFLSLTQLSSRRTRSSSFDGRDSCAHSFNV